MIVGCDRRAGSDRWSMSLVATVMSVAVRVIAMVSIVLSFARWSLLLLVIISLVVIFGYCY